MPDVREGSGRCISSSCSAFCWENNLETNFSFKVKPEVNCDRNMEIDVRLYAVVNSMPLRYGHIHR